MTTTQTFSMEIQEWPSREDITDLLKGHQSKEAVRDFIAREFDTIIHFKIGDFDLLAGYPEAFFLPLHAFLQSLSSGLKSLSGTPSVNLPIYLQQYEVDEGDPAHTLILSWSDGALQVKLQWGGPNEAPEVIANHPPLLVDFQQFHGTIVQRMKEYYQQIALLVGSLSGWESADVAALFAEF